MRVLLLSALLSVSALAETTYWLPIVERTATTFTYRYEAKAPPYFAEWLKQKTVLGGGETVTKTIDGQQRVFVKQFFAWDSAKAGPAVSGQIRVDDKKERWASTSWKHERDLMTQADVIRALDSGAAPSGNEWRSLDLLALQWDGDTPPQLVFSEEIPPAQQGKFRMHELSKTTQQAQFYPEVRVPADIKGFREAILQVVNTGRRDPDYRKGKTNAPDLGADFAKTVAGWEKIYQHSKTPPYFRDLELDDRLNDLAQIQAEWAARENPKRPAGDDGVKHTGPMSFNGVKMLEYGDRAKHFTPQYSGVGEAGSGRANGFDMPEAWMRGETHFRPWFNVYSDTAFVGFGVAVDRNGKLEIYGVGASTRPHTATHQSDSYTFHLPLKPGEAMAPEKKYPSVDGRQLLIWAKDGLRIEQVFYATDRQRKDRWTWGLGNSEAKVQHWQVKSLVMSSTGQLEALDENKKVLWTAPSTKPALNGKELSQTPVVLPEGVVPPPTLAPTPAPAPMPATPQVADVLPLPAGRDIVQGKKYRSPSGGHYLYFQPDGNLAVYTTADQHVWDMDTLAPRRKDAKTAKMEADGNLVVRDAAGNHIWSALHKDPDSSASLTITPAGALQLVSGKTGKVLWSTEPMAPPAATGKAWQVERTLEHDGNNVRCLAWSPDSSQVATGVANGLTLLWSMDKSSGHPASRSPVAALAFSPDGAKIAISSDDKSVYLKVMGEAGMSHVLSGHTGPLVALAWSPDGSKLITVDESLRIWNPATGAIQHTVKLAAGVSAALSPDQSKIAVLTQGRGIVVFDCGTGAEIQALPSSVSTTRLAWSPDGTKIASGGLDRHFRVWSVADGKSLHAITWGQEDVPTAVAWSPDGSKIAVTSQKPAYLVRVLDAATGLVQHSMPGEVGMESDVAWSPDGSMIASGTWNGTLLVWNAASGASMATLPIPDSHTGSGIKLAWSPDGQRVGYGNGYSKVMVASYK